MKRIALTAALLLGSIGSVSWAQMPADHDAHHPDQKQSQPAPSAGPAGMTGQGMMGQGGSQGMMGRGGMMGGNMPMANMMQMMMGMMGRSGGEAGCGGMDGMATIDHVEGRIAFLKTELKITDAQTTAWNAFADALRSNAKSLGEVRASMMSQEGAAPQGMVERLTLQEKWLAARLEGTRAITTALTGLAATFSDEQKKAADELLAPHMGMGAMAGAMQSGQMGSGQMRPGMMMQGR